MTYPRLNDTSSSVPASPKFPEIEERILKYWDKDGTFKASIENRDAGCNGDNEFVFYDGPPFANGLPHYGHLLTGYAKDLVARYQTQKGHRVERRFGWDTHGLPAELEVQKQLGINGKDDIEEMGIAAFNEACRASVMKYTEQWKDYVNRQARWVDFDNDYKTLNLSYMESVMWAFKELYNKGLIYEGYRVLPYCWKDETPLSNHELRMDEDVYKDVQDRTATVGLKLETGELILVWTTTPWTLPSNLAVAVNPEITYALVEPGEDSKVAGEKVILAKNLVKAYEKELGEDAKIVETFPGTKLVGKTYRPPFPYFENHEDFKDKAFQVLPGDFVTTEDGTGLVHMAPGFGEDDKALCDEAGISTVVPVDAAGKFDTRVKDYEGLQVFEANRPIMKDLINQSGPVASQEAVLVKDANYVHSYPHCWRCRQPLIYKAVTSWFVEVTKFKDRMVELNQGINWMPNNVKDGQFGKWLENARDWSISRNRYWGSPIPVWVSDNPEYPRTDVYGSAAELEADFGELPRNKDGEVDLHRPFIDELTRQNPDDPSGKSTMRRVTDILDVWFDSGSMPYAQVHYPMENKEWFKYHSPGDFIVEYIGQTRGWFYLLHVLSTGLFDRAAFKNALSHGIVLGSDGQKMSKSLRNYPDVSEVFDRDGSDAMRWFLMASPILRGGNLIVTEKGIREGVRQVMLPMWSTWYFFSLYANAAYGGKGYEAKEIENPKEALDKYILGKVAGMVDEITKQLDEYDISGACETLRKFFDTLTNWYVRRSRQRFWDDDTDAFDTLYTCLKTATEVAAPLLPLISEEIWRGLTGERSVHLADWPKVDFKEDTDLAEAMDTVRAICSTGSSLRKAEKLRVRLPLNKLTVVTDQDFDESFANIIKDELNVKQVDFLSLDSKEAENYGVAQKLTINARALGPRLGRDVQVVIKASKTGDWSVNDDVVTAGGFELNDGEYTLETVAGKTSGEAIAMLPTGGFVVLDTTLTPELEAEGAARDVIRAIQQERRSEDLDVTDRIELKVTDSPELIKQYRQFEDLIAQETLSKKVSFDEGETAISVKKVS
ncbi:MAG: isoleucine--tRNA ligase [Micrococcaceae bacterium]